MSEQGWRDFLSAEGVEDWVVLHGGPTAVFRVGLRRDVSVAREVAEKRLAAALAAGGHIVDESSAPAAWILADRAGNKVCIAAWPDGAAPADPDAQA